MTTPELQSKAIYDRFVELWSGPSVEYMWGKKKFLSQVGSAPQLRIQPLSGQFLLPDTQLSRTEPNKNVQYIEQEIQIWLWGKTELQALQMLSTLTRAIDSLRWKLPTKEYFADQMTGKTFQWEEVQWGNDGYHITLSYNLKLNLANIPVPTAEILFASGSGDLTVNDISSSFDF